MTDTYRQTALRSAGIVFVAGLAIVALDRLPQPNAGVAAMAITAPPPSGPARDYEELAAQQGAALSERRGRAATRGGEWLIQEQLARAAFARGRLTGSYDDYLLAQQALDRAFDAAPAGTGPHLSQAILHLMMHRLDGAEDMLDAIEGYAVPPDAGERAEIAGMRGDIAFYRGDYAGALGHYDEADRIEPGAADFRRAVFLSKTGRADLAEQHFDSYEKGLVRPDRHMRANMELQRGILDLDAGRWTEALAHFREAEEIFPGWWLVEEHIAETMALLGDKAGAERLYRDIVARTGAPEFMDTLAALLIERGAAEEAEALRKRSAILWDRRTRMFPQASYAHALDHCTGFGRTECALRLARRNHQARPFGEAGEQLASALADSGRMEEARAVIDPVLASAWRTADSFATGHRIYEALGERSRADALRRLALALNPRIFG